MKNYSSKFISKSEEVVSYISHDGLQLALHQWLPKQCKAVMFYLHGAQSHAGWLFEMAPYLAAHNIAVYVLDRRGAGQSEGLRGDIFTAEAILADYRIALKAIVKKHPQQPLTLFGQCLGGVILAALVAWDQFNIPYQKIIFCASALGKRYLQSQAGYELPRATTQLIDLPLLDEDFTEEPFYLNFIKQDPLCFKKITQRSEHALLQMDNLYMQKPGLLNDKTAVYIYPEVDPIVNLPQAITVFQQLTDKQGILKSIPGNKHYVWFSSQNRQALAWLANLIKNE